MNPKKHLFFTNLQIIFIYFVKILSADGHTQLNVKTFTGRSACEVITAVVETIHTTQELTLEDTSLVPIFNEN